MISLFNLDFLIIGFVIGKYIKGIELEQGLIEEEAGCTSLLNSI